MADRLRLFPLNTVLFPGAVLNLHVFEPRYKKMIAECIEDGEAFGVCLIREGREAGDVAATPHEVGTTAEIADVTPLENGRYYITTTGRRRFRIENLLHTEPYLTAEVAYLGEEETTVAAAASLVAEIRDVFRDYLRLVVKFSGMHADIDLPADPSEASFLIGDALQVADSMKQRLLELPSTEQRLTVELGFLRRLLPQLRSLLERKRDPPAPARAAASAGEAFRATQEKFFGKHFSVN